MEIFPGKTLKEIHVGTSRVSGKNSEKHSCRNPMKSFVRNPRNNSPECRSPECSTGKSWKERREQIWENSCMEEEIAVEILYGIHGRILDTISGEILRVFRNEF